MQKSTSKSTDQSSVAMNSDDDGSWVSEDDVDDETDSEEENDTDEHVDTLSQRQMQKKAYRYGR